MVINDPTDIFCKFVFNIYIYNYILIEYFHGNFPKGPVNKNGIDSNNGLVPNRRQVFIRVSNGLLYRGMSVSLGLYEVGLSGLDFKWIYSGGGYSTTPRSGKIAMIQIILVIVKSNIPPHKEKYARSGPNKNTRGTNMFGRLLKLRLRLSQSCLNLSPFKTYITYTL